MSTCAATWWVVPAFLLGGLLLYFGEALQLQPIKPMLKARRTKRLKLKYDELLSNSAVNFN
jgi:hypothetical protein